MVMKASQIVDISLTPGDKTSGFLTPIVGIESGIQIDYDRKTELIYWVEGKEDDDENVSYNSKILKKVLFYYFKNCTPVSSAQYSQLHMEEGTAQNFWLMVTLVWLVHHIR